MGKILITFFITFFYNSVYGLENKIIIASTTSTYDTGLMDEINNKFNETYNIQVQVLALGTGQAIRAAIDGNAELLLVHHTPSELEFMNKGYGIIRYELMSRDEQSKWNREQVGDVSLGTLLVEHLGGRTIRTELIVGESPEEVTGFSENSQIYRR